MGYLADSYRDLNPLKTDMYQLTMAQGYFDQGRQDEEVSFYMHWRNPPFNGGYTVAAGLEGVVDFLNHFQFKPQDIMYLRTLEKKGKRLFSDEFLDYLQNTKLKLDVDAVPEGTVMTGSGPVIRVTGPLAQAQLVESAILNIVNSSSIVATRAARLDDVADGRPLADFSLRRAATLDSAVARSSYIGGIGAVADFDAARRLGIPPTGTMAHAWIMGFKAAVKGYVEAKKAGKPDHWISSYHQSPDRNFYENLVRDAVDKAWPHVTNSEIELVAFKAYLKSMPTNSVLLIDTFEPIQGVRNAIRAAIEMNVELEGVRLDSGDIYALSWESKALLDAARKTHPELFDKTRIYATDGLDEIKIRDLQQRAIKEKGEPLPIGVYGVGTELGNPGPLRGGVYKVSANEIIREDFETNIDKDDKAETIIVGSRSVPIKRDMVRTMKVAGVSKEDPSLPGPKSSMPGYALNTLRLKDANGKQLDGSGNIIGLKVEGGRIRKVEVTTANGLEPNAADRGRVTAVKDEFLDKTFDEMRAEGKLLRTQTIWTTHCVQGTPSSLYPESMGLPKGLVTKLEGDLMSRTIYYRDPQTGNQFHIVRKGADSELDSYGIGVENDGHTLTPAMKVFHQISDEFRSAGVEHVDMNIGGLATNFCVEFSANHLNYLLSAPFKMKNMDVGIHYMPEISRGIPIAGGKDVPFSVEGTAARLADRGIGEATMEQVLAKAAHTPGADITGDIAAKNSTQGKTV